MDGNVYDELLIGTQSWLKENINRCIMPDGTPSQSVYSYNSDSLVNIYGRFVLMERVQ